MSAVRQAATAFAPASIGNVAVGFDILGLAVGALGDRVTARVQAEPGVRISAISGAVLDLPREASRNTAGKAVEALLAAASAGFGVELEIEKGIPLGSGLGGSAASAVAAVVAANALLSTPLPLIDLLACAVEGEAVASGSRHADNVAPSLFGGLALTIGAGPFRVTQIPMPSALLAVVVHPHLVVATREARAILSRSVSLADYVAQSGNLAGFIAGCYAGDIGLIRASLADVIIEPQRQKLIPGFDDVKGAAMDAGALGCSISGAGPTMFALAEQADADAVLASMQSAFAALKVGTDGWVVDVHTSGARLIDA